MQGCAALLSTQNAHLNRIAWRAHAQKRAFARNASPIYHHANQALNAAREYARLEFAPHASRLQHHARTALSAAPARARTAHAAPQNPQLALRTHRAALACSATPGASVPHAGISGRAASQARSAVLESAQRARATASPSSKSAVPIRNAAQARARMGNVRNARNLALGACPIPSAAQEFARLENAHHAGNWAGCAKMKPTAALEHVLVGFAPASSRAGSATRNQSAAPAHACKGCANARRTGPHARQLGRAHAAPASALKASAPASRRAANVKRRSNAAWACAKMENANR